MAIQRDVFRDAVYSAVDVFNSSRSSAQRLPKEEAAWLLGNASSLDSLGLVTIIVAIEEALESSLGLEVDIAELLIDNHEEATVGDLIDVILELHGSVT